VCWGWSDPRASNSQSSVGATGIGRLKAMGHRSQALDSSLTGGHRGVFGLEIDGAANGFRGEVPLLSWTLSARRSLSGAQACILKGSFSPP
jgi:hypothetical protein